MLDLSPHQERLWFLQRLDPTDSSYNVFWVQRLTGRLDPAALARALTAVAARHEVLRTRYLEQDGVPRAEVAPPAAVPLERLTVPGDPDPLHRLVAERVAEPFDLAAGAPLRAALLAVGPAEHVLCLVLHHIAVDGWSMQLVGAEVAALYRAFTEGKPDPLPPLAMTHREHVAEQRGAAGRAAGERALAHWTAALAGVPDLELPTDAPRAAVRETAGGLARAELSAELMAAVDRLARSHRATAFMVLLAAYQVLLARHSGQRDFCVGTPVAGRSRVEHEGLVGCLATTVALRADLAGEPDFDQLVDRVRATALTGFAHQQLPFAELLTALDVTRDRSRTPLFQAMFALQHAQSAPLAPEDGASEVFQLEYAQAKCDLALEIWREDGRAELHLSYAAALFTRETAQRLLARYLTLLQALLAEPDRSVFEVALLPAAEQAELLARGEGAALAVPESTVPARFLAQAERAPEAVALECAGGPVRYGELAASSARVTGQLQAAGVRPGDVVGVFVERSPELLAALLGVWRAGASYLPLDPKHAAERTALALADSGAACVLVTAGSAPLLPAAVTAPRVLLDPGAEPGTDALPGLDRPAYVIYTSGSTGRPKGVLVGHRALAAFLDATGSLVGGTGPDTCWLGLTSVSFDISGLEMYLPLSTGGRLVVPGQRAAEDGAALRELVRAHGVTHLQATPTGWQLLLAGGLSEVPVALVGGEALPLPLARELRARAARLFNMYGPTETTIWSSCWEVPAEPATVSLGGPLPGTRLRVLDQEGGLSPFGVPGELVIGGAGVALGYLGNPELTAQRFVPDPWGTASALTPPALMYRTGDLVRYRADGGLEFLGRSDHQVKVRGHRVELGEVEAALLADPGVRQAAAALHGEVLVGYVTGGADPERLRARLAKLLPGYAVPQTVLVLAELPTTPNGKLDRAALPAPTPTATPASGAEYAGAAAVLHEIWCEVLSLPAIGPDDDLFDLGGHSLTMARIAARALDRLGAELPLHVFFDAPTIRGLAQYLEEAS
ncbi:amino acid adenylation domain-containing protein [Kitasatospora sp. NPDC006697]|uniref:non-ribosomal peptide synthetase n=1 Tax=Kitasatospora sp. NPDC006697 TaxID=3364020 RepID=UPI0036843EA3